MSQRADLSKLEIEFINKALLTEIFAAKARGAKEEAMFMTNIRRKLKIVHHQPGTNIKLLIS